jgi:hypothetical protein
MSALFLFSIIAIGFAAGCCLPDQHEALALGFDRPKNATFFETISYGKLVERSVLTYF